MGGSSDQLKGRHARQLQQFEGEFVALRRAPHQVAIGHSSLILTETGKGSGMAELF
jgi:hypothetical protein